MIRCPCGAAHTIAVPAGEDVWAITLHNATGHTDNGRRDYSCNTCGEVFDYADPGMLASEAEATP